jgi:hypothetical protein
VCVGALTCCRACDATSALSNLRSRFLYYESRHAPHASSSIEVPCNLASHAPVSPMHSCVPNTAKQGRSTHDDARQSQRADSSRGLPAGLSGRHTHPRDLDSQMRCTVSPTSSRCDPKQELLTSTTMSGLGATAAVGVAVHRRAGQLWQLELQPSPSTSRRMCERTVGTWRS